MNPPPGRRRSLLDKTDSLMDIKPHASCDADPSVALTSHIAASILQDGYGVRATKSTVPLKIQDAVGRCLQEVSTTVEDDHPQWALPTYYADRFLSSTPSPDSDQFPDYLSSSSLKRTSNRICDIAGDPFRYDQLQDSRGRRGSGHRGLNQIRKAKVLDAFQAYPCPFRRRSPVIFNVRDHEYCAKRPFSSMAELKYVPAEIPTYPGVHAPTNMGTGVMSEPITESQDRHITVLGAKGGFCARMICLNTSWCPWSRCARQNRLPQIPPKRALRRKWIGSSPIKQNDIKLRHGKKYGGFYSPAMQWFWIRVS